jgi:hypothetical protein
MPTGIHYITIFSNFDKALQLIEAGKKCRMFKQEFVYLIVSLDTNTKDANFLDYLGTFIMSSENFGDY